VGKKYEISLEIKGKFVGFSRPSAEGKGIFEQVFFCPAGCVTKETSGTSVSRRKQPFGRGVDYTGINKR